MSLAGFSSALSPVRTVAHVDLDRFMGDWYVIASIPTFIEHDAHNAVESYRRAGDRQIDTTFRFNKGAFDGPLKIYNPVGYVTEDPSNAIWGMQFIWPFKGDFRIIYLDDDYQLTVIGRAKRDYVWIMSRSPEFSDAEFERMKAFIESVGYDGSKLERPPHGKG